MYFTVYGRDNCSWCAKATKLLDDNGFSYTYEKLDTKEKQVAFFEMRPGVPKTVPQIYDGETYIGGYSELANYIAAFKSEQ